jgi:hypothetical protein
MSDPLGAVLPNGCRQNLQTLHGLKRGAIATSNMAEKFRWKGRDSKPFRWGIVKGINYPKRDI